MGLAQVEMICLRDIDSCPLLSNRRKPGMTSEYVTKKSSGSKGMKGSMAGHASACEHKSMNTSNWFLLLAEAVQDSLHDAWLHAGTGTHRQHVHMVASAVRCAVRCAEVCEV